MSELDVLTVDFSEPQKSTDVLPFSTLLSSQIAGWKNIYLQVYGHSPAWETPVHVPEQHLISIQLENGGSVERRINDRQQTERVRAGDCFLVPKNAEHWCAWSQPGVEFMVMTLDPHFVSKVAYESADPDRIELLPAFSQQDPFIYGTGLALQEALKTHGAASQFYAETLSQSLAVHLLTNYATRPAKLRDYEGGLSRYQLRQAIAYIEANLCQPIKLADIAQMLGMSQYYFCRMFKDSTGITPYKYVIQQRIKLAKMLLKQIPQRPISDVALECGFSNQSHLCQQFREVTGTTPNAYRRSLL